MKKGIGFKLTSIMLCVILLGIIITVGVAVAIAGNVITRESLAKIERDTGRESAGMNDWLSSQQACVHTLADVMSTLDDFSEAQQASIFKSVLDSNKSYFEVYMGYPNNEATTGSGYKFDYSWWEASQRGWYKLAMTDTSYTHITSPYIDAQTQELCITVSRAVYREGTLLGVVSADIFVDDLQEMTLSVNLDSTGYAFLLDSNGDIIVHQNEEYAPDSDGNFNNLAKIANGVYADLWNRVSDGETMIKYRDASGKMKYYTANKLDASGWILMTALPANVVSRPITTVILIAIPLVLIILAVAAWIILRTVKNVIIKPLEDIHENIDRISNGSRQIADGARQVAQGSSDQYGSIEQLSGTVTSLVSSIIYNADMAKLAASLSDSVKESAEKGKIQMEQMISAISEINSATKSIEKVMLAIDDIAFQTNILALNATVEAARAGVEGRSFGVVAEEVRNLAGKSAAAAKTTESIIANSIQKARLGAHAAEETSESLRSIAEGISKSTKIANDIAVSISAQTDSTNEINKNITQVANIVRKNSESAQDSASASREMSDQTDMLANMVSQMM